MGPDGLRFEHDDGTHDITDVLDKIILYDLYVLKDLSSYIMCSSGGTQCKFLQFHQVFCEIIFIQILYFSKVSIVDSGPQGYMIIPVLLKSSDYPPLLTRRNRITDPHDKK